MRPMSQLFASGAALVALCACTALPPAKTPALGIPFNEEAKQGYVRLAGAQRDRGDLGALLHFHGKAKSAMIGDVVPPDRVASRTGLPPEARTEALEHRRRLVTALEARGREAAPGDAAMAQVNFDCWLEQLEARLHLAEAGGCKEAFLVALEQTESALLPPAPFVVLFPEGSAELDQQAIGVIRAAARAAGRFGPARIDVVGYADPAGTAAGNQQLSQDRARAVADQLVGAGIPARVLNVEGRGGAQISPIRAENRRVEIALAR